MKIIEPGTTPPASHEPFWVGFTLQCWHCKAKVQLEVGDKVETSQERHPGGKSRVAFTCPTSGCGATIKASYVWNDGHWVNV